ncbi:uncharacterized protein FA14DRAFT_159821 [Meira miltonrushii]|uniref:UBR-type domain-containing protein n=1 Tax=Meira miltonrushii TaxID=1280837 RepID=A0A316VKG8_9BASI|nr:uncharacterized protein FA14DRAFT_159821 [Meira miltonrushii]PWN38082.1 hypothetical protein FA14DRAFT_159821 [Meira miltonrushii]
MENQATSSSTQLPDPSLPAPPLQDDEQGFTAAQLIEKQAELEEAARQAVPFSFTKGGCTYERGYIRQPVYACKTCGGGGVCAGCSVGCHADHELVELFAKRNFRCDCGTLSLCRGKSEKEKALLPCSLRIKELNFAPQNDENTYNQNFDGQFCRCERGKSYDPEKEDETMFQCLICEDWLHESCTSLRPHKSPLEASESQSPNRSISDGPLVDHESFELFICHECIQKPTNYILRRYLGAKGWIICLPEGPNQILPKEIDGIPAIPVVAKGEGWTSSWKVYGLLNGTTLAQEKEPVQAKVEQPLPTTMPNEGETKRKASEEPSQEDGKSEKRARKDINGLSVLDNFSDADNESVGGADAPLIPVSADKLEELDICIEPDVPLFVQEEKVARLDIFLTESFRDRICRCKRCAPDWTHLPFLLAPEETYSPPQSQVEEDGLDGRSEAGGSQTSSTYDLGLAALSKLPRERMMESLQAYNKMRDALFDHLRPFADQGKVVDAESVREFFRKQKEGNA